MQKDFNNIPPAIKSEMEEVLNNIRLKKTNGIRELSAILEKQPDYLEAMGHLAWAYALNGDYEKSIEIYYRCQQITPDDMEISWRIADRLVNLGRIDEARKIYDEVLLRNPECFDARYGIKYLDYLSKSQNSGKDIYKINFPQISEIKKNNLALNKEEYKKQSVTLKSLPPNVFLESTTKCNFYCKTCVKAYESYYAEDLRPDVLRKFKNELLPYITLNTLTGFGEPTIAGCFDELLTMSFESGAEVLFVTNGSTLTFRRLEILTKYPVRVIISLDGATKETFESIRQGGNFENTLEKLAMIKKMRDIHLSQVFSRFSVNFVGLRNNIHELADVVKLAKKYSILNVHVSDYNTSYREFDKESLRFEPERANKCIEEAKSVAKEIGVSLDVPPPYITSGDLSPSQSLSGKLKKVKSIFPEKNRFPKKCHSPWQEPYIHTDGRVSPCCITGETLGNLSKNSFYEIWNNFNYKLLRIRINSFFPPVYCRNCSTCWGINGGNSGNAKAKEGLLIKILYFLEIHLTGNFRKIAGFFKRICGVQPPAPNYAKGKPIRGEKNNQ